VVVVDDFGVLQNFYGDIGDVTFEASDQTSTGKGSFIDDERVTARCDEPRGSWLPVACYDGTGFGFLLIKVFIIMNESFAGVSPNRPPGSRVGVLAPLGLSSK
jgi:hypothetical protein